MRRYNVTIETPGTEVFEQASRKCFDYRRARNIAQADMAALVNTYPATICALERGRFKKVPKHVVLSIVDAERFIAEPEPRAVP